MLMLILQMAMATERCSTAAGKTVAAQTLAAPRPPLPPRNCSNDHLRNDDHRHHRPGRFGSLHDEHLLQGDRGVGCRCRCRCHCRALGDRRRGRRVRSLRLAPRTRPPSLPTTAGVIGHRQQRVRALKISITRWPPVRGGAVYCRKISKIILLPPFS